jgi:hypothetical protein
MEEGDAVLVCGFCQLKFVPKNTKKRDSVGALCFPIVARKTKCMLRGGIRESI